MKNNKEKRRMKEALLILFAIVFGMSLFACKSKTKNITSTNQIKVDVNSPEVQATLGAVRNYEAEKLLPSGTAEREKQVWTKRNHKWAEPPEEDKIYINDKKDAWVSAYVYNEHEYWVNGTNTGQGARKIFKKTSDNYKEDIRNTLMAISPDVNDEVYNLIAELEAGRDISKNMRGNSDTINITK